ncbi:MAG: hypothetical protein VCC01_07680, partial [Candidatus Hydrogenedentota bacterium]
YSVEIDGNAATFDLLATPLIGINSIYEGYNAYFNMLTPPGILGIKDAALIDVASIENPESPAIKADAYEYIIGGGIGQWVNVTIQPNPVGPLDAGELEVVIEITEEFSGSFEAFIVPQGGNPANQDHRINLANLSTGVSSDGNPTWTGTNAISITTELYGGLYADGHAAIFLNTGTDGIVGDDFVSPFTDSGKIIGDALINRHFIIDTIPPVMLTTGIASIFVDSSNSDAPLRPNDVIGNPTHPYQPVTTNPLPPNVEFKFPVSIGEIVQDPSTFFLPPLPGPQSPLRNAQRFFNVASISNDAPIENLFLQVSAEFIDRDVDTILGTDSALGLPDRFNGDTIRQPAGFDTLTTSIMGDQNQVLIGLEGDGNIRARWVLQGGSSSLPNVQGVSAQFLPSGSNITTGFVYAQTGIPSVTQMAVAWNLYGGISPDDISDPMHLITKFAAGDRATIYLPRGDISLDARSVMTTRDQQLDPLHIWWMREVNTNIFRDNIPANGVTRTPRFQWEISGRPRAELTAAKNNPYPLFSYQLWQSPRSANTEEFRDGPYTQVLGGYGDWNALNTGFEPVLSTNSENKNSWFLLTVAAIDEAGNVEQWPANELSITVDPETGNLSLNVIGVQSGGGNWRRFYYPSAASEIDTEVTPFFWHDRQPS